MPWALEIVEGSVVTQRVDLKPSSTVTIGCGAAMVSLHQDESIAAPEFALSLVAGIPRVRSLNSNRPVEVNGQAVSAADLRAGDQLRAGSARLVVVGPAPSPYPAILRFGGWGFEFVPEDCQPIEGVGFHLTNDPAFRASITAVEEPLVDGQTLSSYAQTQMLLAKQQSSNTIVQGPVPTKIRGAEALSIKTSTAVPTTGTVFQRQIYATSGDVAGIMTVTMLDSQEEQMSNTLALIERGVSYFNG